MTKLLDKVASLPLNEIEAELKANLAVFQKKADRIVLGVYITAAASVLTLVVVILNAIF